MKRIFAAAAGLLLLAATAHGALAGAVTVGVADTGNCYPFMCNDSGSGSGPSIQYQQVYAASAFPGTVTINAETFYWVFEQINGGTDTLLGGTYVFSLSTTPVAVNALDPNCLTCNLGADNTEVLSITIPTGGVLFGSAYTFNNTTDFTYDPTQGNLLLDVAVSNQDNVPNCNGTPVGCVDPHNSFTDADDTGLVTSRAVHLFDGADVFFPDTTGLVTTFSTTTPPGVPEPGSLLLLAGGLAGFAGLLRCRPRASQGAEKRRVVAAILRGGRFSAASSG